MTGVTPSLRSFEPLNAAADDPLALLHFAFRAVVAAPDDWLAQLGLGRVHHRILFFIARTPRLRVTDLVATLGVSKQALNGPLRVLLKQGLVRSTADADDARERRLSLTTSGKALERRLSGHQRRLFARAFAKAGSKAEAHWQTVMRELIRASLPELELESRSGKPKN